MKTHPIRLLPAVLCALAVASTHAQTVERVILTKGSSWLQTSAADPVLEPRYPGPNYGGPFNFLARVEGINLAGIAPPVITLAAGSLYPSQNPVRHNGGVMAYRSSDQAWGYGIDGNNWGGTSEAARDAAFAFGTYGMSVLGESFTLAFPATAFPANTPKVTLSGGTWSGGKYLIDPAQPLTITTNAFTNFGQNVDAYMELWVDGTNVPGAHAEALRSDNPGAPNFLTTTIPANSLVAGVDYDAGVGFYALTDKRLPNAGRLDAATYTRWTSFKISAIPPAVPGALAKLHGVGELSDGSTFSEVRDATKFGGVIYAVGDSNSYGLATGGDTAFVWTSTDGIRPLPDIVTNFTGTNFSSTSAIALTPNAAYIASRARATANAQSRHAVRVTTSSLANLDLGTLVGFTNSEAHTISNDGAVLYGIANYTNLSSVPVKTRAVRFTAGSTTPTIIPFLNVGDTNSAPADRATSADGSVVVGRSTNGTVDASTASPGGNGIGLGNQAFRYVHGVGVSAIPFLPGGTWSGAVAVSADGNLTLVRGDSASAPQGEFYLHNAGTGALTSFGTPNGSRRPGGILSMTNDGVVFAAPFVTADNPIPFPYIHNAQGYHDFHRLVERAGVDLTGWSLRENIFGISADGTLAWGRGVHNGNREGFVVEFAPGYLASYTEPEVYSAPEPTIVGAWSFDDFPSNAIGGGTITFFSNGYYVIVETALPGDAPTGISGFERGQYAWNAATGAITFTTLVDTGGDYGLSGSNGAEGMTLTLSGDHAVFSAPGEAPHALTRVVSTAANAIVGAWGEGTVQDNSVVAVFLPNGYYFMAQDGDSTPAGDPSGHDGMEWGTYTWNPATGAFTATALVDTNGEWGFSHPEGPQTFTITEDLLTLVGNSGEFALSRVGAAPATVTLSNLSQGFDGAPKTISVTTVPANIPVNVTYNGSSTAPSALGTYAVVATVTDPNYFGSANATLVITDVTPPVLTLPGNVFAEATSPAGAIVTFTASAVDYASGSVPVMLSAASGSQFPIGVTTVTASATDAAGNRAEGSFTVTVQDTTAPAITSLTASSTSLWPANHKLVPIVLHATTTDAVGGVTVSIVSAASSEPDNGLGDGDTANDIVITGPMTLNLRAERAGTGNGRTYTITVQARDSAGNVSTETVLVNVPKSQGGS